MARYSDAVRWIAQNDDTCDLQDAAATGHPADLEECDPSVTMALVADLFGKSDMTVKRDILRELRSAH